MNYPANFHRMTPPERAYVQSPGQGMPTEPLNRKWCFWCGDTKPTLGGKSYRRSVFKCAQCREPKS